MGNPSSCRRWCTTSSFPKFLASWFPCLMMAARPTLPPAWYKVPEDPSIAIYLNKKYKILIWRCTFSNLSILFPILLQKNDPTVWSALRQVEAKAEVAGAIKTLFCRFFHKFVDASNIHSPARLHSFDQLCFTPIQTSKALRTGRSSRTQNAFLLLPLARQSCRPADNDEGRKSHKGEADVSHGGQDFRFSSPSQFQCQSCCEQSMRREQFYTEHKSALIHFACHWCWSNASNTHPGVGRHEPLKLWLKAYFAILEEEKMSYMHTDMSH